MRRAVLLVLVILAAASACLSSNSFRVRIAKAILEDLTRFPVEIQSVQLTPRDVCVRGIKISRDDEFFSAGEICLQYRLVGVRHLLLPALAFHGIESRSRIEDGLFEAVIANIIEDSPGEPPIDVSVHDLFFPEGGVARFESDFGSVELKPTQLTFHLAPKRPTVEGQGEVDLLFRLPETLAPLKHFSGPVEVRGELENPFITTQLKQDTTLPLVIAGKLENGRFMVRPTLRGAAAELSGEIELIRSRLEFHGFSAKRIPLAVLTNNVEGELDLSAEGWFDGTKGELSGKGEIRPQGVPHLRRAEFSFHGEKELTLSGVVKGEGGDVATEILLGEEGVTARLKTEGYLLDERKNLLGAKIQALADGEISIRAVLPAVEASGELRVSRRVTPFGSPTPRESIGGAFSVQLKSQLPDLVESAQGDVTLKPLEYPEWDLKLPSPTVVNVKGGVLHLVPTQLLVGDHALSITGSASTDELKLSVRGAAGLAELLSPFPVIDDASGELELDVDILGSFEKPRLVGRIIPSAVTFAFESGESLLVVRDVQGEAVFDDTNFEIRNGTAHLNGAPVQISGRVTDFLDQAKRKGEFYYSVEQVRLDPMEGLHTAFGSRGEMRFVGEERPRVTGEIAISEAVYEQRIQLRELITRFFQFLAPERGRGQGVRELPMDLKLHLRADRSILVDTDLLQAELSSDLTLETFEQKPFLTGKVETNSGDLDLGQSELIISRGELLFDHTPIGELPSLLFIAEGTVQSANGAEFVQLDLKGKLPNPEISLQSETGRNERELLGLLGAGLDRIPFARANERLRLVEVLSPFSGVSLFDRVSGLTGVTEVEVESGYSSDTGEFAPRLSAHRPLPLGFHAVAQAELTQFSRTQLNLEYSLTEQTNFFAGWRNAPTTKNPESLTGSFGVGFHYRERFHGSDLFPGELILENLRELGR